LLLLLNALSLEENYAQLSACIFALPLITWLHIFLGEVTLLHICEPARWWSFSHNFTCRFPFKLLETQALKLEFFR